MNTQVRAQDRTENHELTEEARRRSEECCGVTYLAEEGPSEGASVARAPRSVLPPSLPVGPVRLRLAGTTCQSSPPRRSNRCWLRSR